MFPEHFIEQVKLNCDISDSKSWGNFSICGLLMRMRELYLNEHSLQPWEAVPMEKIAAWIQDREARWKDLESKDLSELVVGGVSYTPFDVDRLNGVLGDSGLLYGSGFGVMGKPTFFVAEIASQEEIYDYCVYHAGHEFCRDLAAYPAMLQGRCIYLRLAVVRTMLWDKFQTLRSGRYRGATEDMFLRFGIGRGNAVSDGFVGNIEKIAHRICGLFVLHETGEAFEDDYWDEWREMLRRGFDRQTELYLRGVKDLLADTSEMGPIKAIVKKRDDYLLTAYAAFLEGVRKEFFPAFFSAFSRFTDSGDWSLIEDARAETYATARGLRDDLVGLWKDGRDSEISAVLRQFIKERSLGN